MLSTTNNHDKIAEDIPTSQKSFRHVLDFPLERVQRLILIDCPAKEGRGLKDIRTNDINATHCLDTFVPMFRRTCPGRWFPEYHWPFLNAKVLAQAEKLVNRRHCMDWIANHMECL